MKKTMPTSAIFKMLLKGSLVILVVGCGSSQVSIGEQNADASAGGAAGRVDAPVSSAKAGGSSALGGNKGWAGQVMGTLDTNAGGGSDSGGDSGASSGGTTGMSSSTKKICATNKACGAGEFCDYPAGSCGATNAIGVCVNNAGIGGCMTSWQPVCGCDGQTYGNDCERLMYGVSKRSEGECVMTDSAWLCVATGGEVTTQLCCANAGDFPNTCLVGACSCAPTSGRTISVCNCPLGCFAPGIGCFSCTFDLDQTCNNDPNLSSPHGKCLSTGRCICNNGYQQLDNGKCE